VFFAACEYAATLIVDQPGFVRLELSRSVRSLSRPLSEKTAEDLRMRYEEWWDDMDFVLLSDLEGRSPELVAAIKQRLGIDDEAIAPLYQAPGQTQPTSWVATNLHGLLSRSDIEFVSRAVCVYRRRSGVGGLPVAGVEGVAELLAVKTR